MTAHDGVDRLALAGTEVLIPEEIVCDAGNGRNGNNAVGHGFISLG